ncbi:TetR/AcrR family transcriptional regulator [Pseudonocardia xinjiangensis]|uniref:TetR/AcrR family transcriptional regulator n=1 Tax=Pseudonocardia xinjiangensis TaxID=75289 RepID=UPI003D8D5D27
MTQAEPPARREGPGRPRDPGADAAILRAAVELLVERGIDQTSIEQIARRAGVAKVTVYRRWSSKEDLLAQAIETARSEIPDVTTGATGPLPDRIEELLPRWGEVLADPRFRNLSARLLGAGPEHPRLLAAYWHHHVEPRRQQARAVLRQAQADGVLAPTADVDILIDMIQGAAIQHLLLRPGALDAAEITRYLRALLIQAGFSLDGASRVAP